MDTTLTLLIFGIVVVAALVWLSNLRNEGEANKVREVEERERCPHGIVGGKERQLWQICVRIEEKKRLAHQREREWHEAADGLRYKEAARLTQSIIPSLGELRALTPQQFEDAVAKMFARPGYSVTQTSYSHDEGYDGILIKDGQKVLYECKRYGESSTSGRPDLQIFASAIRDNDAVSGFFLTTGIFSQEAIDMQKASR
jgi:restriction endonuclease Mrr